MQQLQKQSPRNLFLIGFMLVLFVGITGCTGMQSMISSQPTQAPVAEEQKPILLNDSAITAEGRLVPKETVDLAFTTSGRIEEIFAEKGEQVNKGDLLARLEGKEQLEAAIAAAEFELFSAQKELKALNDNLESDQNQALQALNTARQAEYDANRRLASLGGVASQTDIDLAYTQLLFAKEELDRAKERFQPYANRPETNLVRARLQVELASAQKAYDQALRKYNGLTGGAGSFDLDQARTDLEIAKGNLKLAQEKYDLLQEGPDSDLVATAEARIKAAESRLNAAKSDLAKLNLIATIDGVIVDSNLVAGQMISPGQAVVQLADFSEWDVETEDLTEIEVVDIILGQKVKIVPDAIPELTLTGEVIEISDIFKEVRGDITYPVRIKIDKIDPRLRWGMTVVVSFEK